MEEITDEAKIFLEKRHSEIVKIIESFENLDKSIEWATLKELVFDRSLVAIEKQLLVESTKPIIDTTKLYKLQGERDWARKFNDVNRFIETLKKELENINKKIK